MIEDSSMESVGSCDEYRGYEERKVSVVNDPFSCLTPDCAISKCPESSQRAPSKCVTDPRRGTGGVCGDFNASKSGYMSELIGSTSDRVPC